MIGTDELSVLSTIRALRYGPLTNDYNPAAIADLLGRFLEERRANAKQLAALESFVTPKSGAAYRNVFAAGFTSCQEAVLRELPLTDLEAEIRALRPNIAEAGKAVQPYVETRQ